MDVFIINFFFNQISHTLRHNFLFEFFPLDFQAFLYTILLLQNITEYHVNIKIYISRLKHSFSFSDIFIMV